MVGFYVRLAVAVRGQHHGWSVAWFCSTFAWLPFLEAVRRQMRTEMSVYATSHASGNHDAAVASMNLIVAPGAGIFARAVLGWQARLHRSRQPASAFGIAARHQPA